jgi:hypothetical protein
MRLAQRFASYFASTYVSPNRALLLKPRCLTIVFLVAIIVALYCLVPRNNGEAESINFKEDPPPCGICPQPTRQVIYAPLFDLPETSSEIVLNSRSSREITITPTFYTLQGEALWVKH